MKINNKGQVLIMFVVMLPIFLLILSLVVDLGLFYVENRKVNNNTYDAVEYYLDNIDDIDVKNKTINLLENNLDDIEVKILDNEENVEITVLMKYNGLYDIIYEDNIIVAYKGIKEKKEIIKG